MPLIQNMLRGQTTADTSRDIKAEFPSDDNSVDSSHHLFPLRADAESDVGICNEGAGAHCFVGSSLAEVTACTGVASMMGPTSGQLGANFNFSDGMNGETLNENGMLSAAPSSWSSASSSGSSSFPLFRQASGVPPLYGGTKPSSSPLDLNTNVMDCCQVDYSSTQAAVGALRSEIDTEKISLSTAIDKGFHGKSSFPMNLCLMLESVEKHNLSHIISWLPCGSGFLIHDPDAFLAKVLPRYFKSSQHTKIRSFYRKLNRWGFTIARAGPSKGAWVQKAFNRQKASECLESAFETGKTNMFDSLSLNHSRTSGKAGSNPGGSEMIRKKKRRESQSLSVTDGNSVATNGNSTDTFRRGSNFSFDDGDDDDDDDDDDVHDSTNPSEMDNGSGNNPISSVATPINMNGNVGHSISGIGYNSMGVVHPKSASAINNLISASSSDAKAQCLVTTPMDLSNEANSNNRVNLNTLIQSSSSAFSSSTVFQRTPDVSMPSNVQNNTRPCQWSRSASFSSPYLYQHPTNLNMNNLNGAMHTNNIPRMQRAQVNPCFEKRASWTEGTSNSNELLSNFQRYMPSRAFFPLNISELTREQLTERESEDLIFDDEPLDFKEEGRNPNEPVSQEDQDLMEFFERLARQLDRNSNS
ncbi:hypothetical protein ACHAXS_002275 [Conticribra weissflogii]